MIQINSKRPLSFALQILGLICALVPALLFNSARAQEATPTPGPTAAPQTVNRADLHQALLDLTNDSIVMCVAAHPDDEDGTTLTVLRRAHGVHTVSLFSTFGEGGQNAVGPELYEELGVIRTEETINASRLQGSEPHFLGMKDFGFSKSSSETFKVWGHDEALRRMVLKIRELRPDAIITNHDTARGHGHHQATGQLLLEAFDAAADTKRFPEQLATVKPWQVQRLFVRMFGGSAQPPAGQPAIAKGFAIDPNQVDPVRGTSFAEQALAALQQHASQGPWPKSVADMMRARRIEGGRLPLIRYQLVREAKGAAMLPENATTPLAGLESTDAADASGPNLVPPTIDGKPLTAFIDQPDRLLAALVDWRAATTTEETSSNESHRSRLMTDRLNRALAAAAGVSLTLKASPAALVPGTKVTFSLVLANGSAGTLQVDGLRFKGWGDEIRLQGADELLPDTETVVTVDQTTPITLRLTVPKEAHLYDDLYRGVQLSAAADVEIDGAKFSVTAPLQVEVVSTVEIQKLSPPIFVRTPGSLSAPLNVSARLINHLNRPFRGSLTLEVVSDGNPRATSQELSLSANEARTVTISAADAVRPRRRVNRRSRSGVLVLFVREGLDIGSSTSKNAPPITESTHPIVYADARVRSGLRVGYLPSYDETLARSLFALGVNSKQLTIEDVRSGDLASYDTIIIDNRGYEAHPDLVAANPRLLEFANAGGTLIVFYHKDNEWNPDPKKNRPQLAPYPITLGGERVTVETAPIRIISPRHPLLYSPNRIGPADFNNWIQERGLYYPKEWDPHYTALFSTNDAGEKSLTGGLLVAPYGKGQYIYTSMVWYRQLRAGVPGAYRMFANMISYGRRPARVR